MKKKYSQGFTSFLKLCLVITIFLFAGINDSAKLFGQTITRVYDTAGTYNFIVPPCVTSVQIQSWGGGGAGGGSASGFTNNAGGGGGGGGYTFNASVTVTPGNSYSVVVGSGGVPSSGGNGGNGGNSSFNGGEVAPGGSGGTAWVNIGAGNGTGGTGGAGGTYTGGTGAGGDHPNCGGGGGGGAGSGGNGANGGTGTACTAGSGGVGAQAGGSGGAGVGNNNGTNGTGPGGGGGGSYTANPGGSNAAGGNGAAGQIIVTYTLLSPTITSLLGGGCTGTTISIGGTNLTGTSSVTINGTAITNLNVTPTTVTGIIAPGTTSGLVTVTTPCGSVTSTTPFTVNPAIPPVNLGTHTFCPGGSYNFAGHNYTTTGVYSDTTASVVTGCDSITSITLAFSTITPQIVNQSICAGNSYLFNGVNYTTTTLNHADTLPGAGVNGCDSIVILNLTVNPLPTGTLNDSICFGGMLNYNGHSYATAGIFNDTLIGLGSNGCDSVVTLNLAVRTSDTLNLYPGQPVFCPGVGTSICASSGFQTYAWDSTTLTGSCIYTFFAGTYKVTATDASGCNTSASVSLSTTTPIVSSIVGNNASCNHNNGSAIAVISAGTGPFTYFWSNTDSTDTISNLAAGTYYLTLVGAPGCAVYDTVIITSTNGIALAAAGTNTTCGLNNGMVIAVISNGTSPYTYVWSNNATTDTVSGLAAGTYSVTVTDINSCTGVGVATILSSLPDSVTITQDKTVMCAGDSASLCAPQGFAHYMWTIGDTTSCITTTLHGTYDVTATDNGGCVAISNALTVSVYPQTAVVLTVSGDTLHVYGGLGYQWYYGTTLLPGDTFAVLIATQVGQYYVAETDTNGCLENSTEQNISSIVNGIALLNNSAGIKIYPNPLRQDNWQLEVSPEWIGSRCELYDVAGKLIYSSEIDNEHTEMSANIAPGIYTVRISSQRTSAAFKLVKL